MLQWESHPHMTNAVVAHGQRGNYLVAEHANGWWLRAVEPNGWLMLELRPEGKAFGSQQDAQAYAEAIDSNQIRAGELSGT